jgi:hypothetical protein
MSKQTLFNENASEIVYKMYMTLKYVIMIGIIATALLMPDVTNAFASDNEPRHLFTEEERESGFYNENGYVKGQSNRPPINPEFDPDYDCLFDVFQLKCIPGSTQECPEPQFGRNDDETCFPKTLVNGEWECECPEGYHSREDDETGQCYPDSEGCEWDGYAMIEREDGEGNTCRTLYSLCHTEKGRDVPECEEWREERNNDDTIENDIPPDGVGYFCDNPSHSGSCYDRNDNPEYFCVNNPQYTKFCEIIGPICDEEGQIYSSDPECTPQDQPNHPGYRFCN